jgi:cell division protein FtsB
MDSKVFLSPFALGLYLGLIFAALAFYRVIRLKFELRGYKRHLNHKLEIDAEQLQKMKRDQDALKKENENLRVKVASLNDNPDRRAQRDLEIFARAEKRMLVSVPGFAPAWEGAKSAAQSELADEEAGRSAPKSVFSKIFGGRVENVETTKTLTDSRPSQPS